MDTEPLLAQGSTPSSTAALAPPSSGSPGLADSAAPAPEQTLYQPGPYQPYQQPYQQQPYQQQPYQQRPYQQQYQQPYGYDAPEGYVPSTAYGGGASDSYNNNAWSVSLNGGSHLVGSVAPLAPPQVSVESLYRDFERVRTSVLVLIVLHCIFWFPLGLVFIECHDMVGRGRRHWTKSICFFTLSLLTCCILIFFYVFGVCMLPHIIIAAISMAKGKEMECLEKALRLVDDHGFLKRYSPARAQTIVVAH